jgi:hypothetical protein
MSDSRKKTKYESATADDNFQNQFRISFTTGGK